MATSTINAYADASNLTNFNAYAYWMYQQFLAFGWLQTADTGQGTFPNASSVPTAAGYYAIFRSADALSAANPITVRIDFWEQSNSPYFQVQVGTGGTDGAGNLVAPYTVKMGTPAGYSLQVYVDDSTNLYPCYATGDAGSIRFALFMNPNLSYPAYYNLNYIVIGRSVNAQGLQTGDFVMVWTGCKGGSQFQTVYSAGIGGNNTVDNSAYMLAPLPYQGTSSAQGGSILAVPVFQNIGGLSNPTPDLLMGKYADFPSGTTVAVTIYNVSHTYLCVCTSQLNGFVAGINSTLLMRYE